MVDGIWYVAIEIEYMTDSKIQSFTDLRVWQEGHTLVILIYKETEHFPQREIFGLTNQMRRAAVSFTSNIAEGFTRNTTKDKLHFYAMARGSLVELQNQLLVARDVGLLSASVYSKIHLQTVVAHKLINAFAKSLKKT